MRSDSEAAMSNQDDCDFAGPDDAKAEIRAAVRYLLEVAAVSDRGDIVREIIEIVTEAARGLPPSQHDPFDDEFPGG
jgi:hypothetical protein